MTTPERTAPVRFERILASMSASDELRWGNGRGFIPKENQCQVKSRLVASRPVRVGRSGDRFFECPTFRSLKGGVLFLIFNPPDRSERKRSRAHPYKSKGGAPAKATLRDGNALRRPGEVVFAQGNFEPALGGKHIHGQAAFPERNHQRKRIALALEQLAGDGDFQDAVGGRGDRVLRYQE